MGHCCSCNELRATDTSIAAEVLAEADEYGTVVPKTKHLAPIARKLDNAIHWIKLYTVDTADREPYSQSSASLYKS